MQSRSSESVFQVLATQTRVIDALMQREIITRFGRENIGFLWLLVEPAMFCMGVVALWHIVKHSGHEETALTPFVITGYMPLLLFRHMTGQLMRCMQANGSLLYHRQITVLSLYCARISVEFLGTTASFFVVMFGFYMAGLIEAPADLSLMIAGWLLYGWVTASFAILIGSLSERSELVDKFWGPLSYLSIPFTGTFFMVYWMPQEFRDILLWSPQINAVEMIRGGYYGASVPAFYYPSFVIGVCAILTWAGLYLMSGSRKHIEVE
jgi:ABC-type polysaccharide/polyol phosphate export permease